MSIIEVSHLKFEYQENEKTINDISFNIEKGSYTVILGPNGSGKSTIAKLLIGLLEKDSGEIIINGIPLNEKNLYKVRDAIGIVFQNPDNQFIGSTVRDDIAFGLENKCIDPERMDEIIYEYAGKVNMLDFLEREPETLSGGQKQRVAIAGILALHPSIIIMDEATSMLDPKGKKEINELVRELNRKNHMTILSITHDIEEAVNSDQVILLNNGRIEAMGKTEDLLMQEELLKSMKLEIPFAYKLCQSLKKQGISLKDTINTRELVNQLCQLHSKL